MKLNKMTTINDLSRTQVFVLLLVSIICLSIIACVIWIVTNDLTYTLHITSDNNTLEIFKSINYTAIANSS